jgi:hypothetical protein
MESTNIGVMSCMHVLCYAFIGGEQDDNKFLEQLVTSLLSSTTLYQLKLIVNKPLTTCQQAGNKLCGELILLTSCWNCYKSAACLLRLVRFHTCVVRT